MNEINAILKSLTELESRFKRAIESAVQAGSYEQVSELAACAVALGGLQVRVARLGDDEESSNAAKMYSAAMPAAATHEAPKGKLEKVRYPYFRREGDKLVKVGWSKQDRREYEHRSEWDRVEAVCSAFAAIGAHGNTFSMDEILPVSVPDGDEVPSYQAYLVLAWLRAADLVDRIGNEGYRILTDRPLIDVATEIWVGMTD